MVRLAVGSLIFALSMLASAQCIIVDDVKGRAAYKANGYEITDDAFGDKTFYIEFLDNPRVLGEQLDCKNVAGHLVCLADNEFNTIIEVWTADNENGVARMIRSRIMHGGLEEMENSSLFVGRIIGSCD